MGATNAVAAYTFYAGKIPATSMQVLVYMALVSKDADANPWFSKGREALAEQALGRPGPFDRADARAVERAIEPLLAVGAIHTERRAAVRRDGSSTAKYRLNLNPTDGPRQTWADKRDHAPRKTSARPTESVHTPHGNRGAEEKEDLSRSEIEEEMADVQTASHPSRATSSPQPAPVIPLFPGTANAPTEQPYRQPVGSRPWNSRSQETLAESSSRRRAAEAEHQARLATKTDMEVS